MALFFSKTTLGYYDTNFYVGALPSDAVKITAEMQQELEQKRQEADGLLVLAADSNGYPTLVKAELTAEEKRAARLFSIGRRFTEIDASRVRALSDIAVGSAAESAAAQQRLQALEAEAKELRLEQARLQAADA